MRYDEYLRLGYGIGSGAVESATNRLCTPGCIKLECPGARLARAAGQPCVSTTAARLYPAPKELPPGAHPTLEQWELTVRHSLRPDEAYGMLPGRDPQNP
jgi:hypothetical protein